MADAYRLVKDRLGELELALIMATAENEELKQRLREALEKEERKEVEDNE